MIAALRGGSMLLTRAAPALRPAAHLNTPTAPLTRWFAAKGDPADVLNKVKPTPAGDMPSIVDQATGLERAEIDNPDLFKHNEVLRGAFGTKENPVKIQSAFASRIVGCTGRAAPDDHDLMWLTVKKGEGIFLCPECGQAFELDPL